MPIHDASHVEYTIDSGHISIVTDKGQRVPAYWAHPRLGSKFSGVVLLHDWWGMNTVTRLLANFYAQMGYYIIAPDMFNGRSANTPKEAMQRLEETRDKRYQIVDAAITAMETHHRINKSVAVLGIGMGGTLAFEAALNRDDLEAAIAYAGFPQHFIGQFERATAPILALYGSKEPYTKPVVIKALRDEFATTPLKNEHKVAIIEGAEHEFFSETTDHTKREYGKQVVKHTLDFLEAHLVQPASYQRPKAY